MVEGEANCAVAASYGYLFIYLLRRRVDTVN